MPLKRSILFAWLIIFLLGLAAFVYLFGQETLRDLYNRLVRRNVVTTQEPGPLTKETIYDSLLNAPIDWASQMKKLQEEGFAGNPFIADILDVNYQTKNLTLNFDFNYGDEPSQLQEIKANAACPAENSSVVSALDLALIAENVDLFSAKSGLDDEGEEIFGYLRTNDILLAYCLNETCTSIGRECVLLRVPQSESE